MWRNDDCPCTRECPDRWVDINGSRPLTCHGTCRRYKEWVVKREQKKKEAAIQAERRCMTSSQKKALWKSYRRDNYGRCTKKFSN